MGPQVELEFHVSPFVFLLGNTFYLVSVAVAPLVLAPFSELVGRKFIFIVSAFVTVLMLIPQALAPSIYGLHIPRIFQGIAASCGNSVTGGVSVFLHTFLGSARMFECVWVCVCVD